VPFSGLALGASLAGAHTCPLVIIVSAAAATTPGRAGVETIVERSAGGRVRPVIIDASELDQFALDLRADESRLALDAWAEWPGTGDTAVKRNLGILVARRQRWRNVLFLDDDIRATHGYANGEEGFELNARNLGLVMGALDRYRAVGWVATAGADEGGHSDNSVVCHVRRYVGYPQGVFLGGGALGVRVDDETPHFPRIYNEDWLFCIQLLLRFGHGALAIAGEVGQDPPASAIDPMRAAMEERGDILAEALMNLMDHRRRFQAIIGSALFWRHVILRRIELVRALAAIAQEQARPDDSDPVTRAVRALQATQQVHARMSVDLDRSARRFRSYVHAWLADRDRWAKHVAEASRGRLPASFDQVVPWRPEPSIRALTPSPAREAAVRAPLSDLRAGSARAFGWGELPAKTRQVLEAPSFEVPSFLDACTETHPV
jgi:hypothetical protein